MAEQTIPTPEHQMKITKGKASYVSSVVVTGNPVRNTLPAVFTRRDFEDALDKVSRPVKTSGKAS